MSILKDLKQGKISDIYLIYGPEAYKRKILKEALKERVPFGESINFQYFEGKDIDFGKVYDIAVTLPFFSEYRLIIIENSGLFKAKEKKDGADSKENENKENKNKEKENKENENEKKEKENESEQTVLKIFKEMPPSTVIVFIEEACAKNKKIYKEIAKRGVVEECGTDSAGKIIEWIKKGVAKEKKSIDSEAARLLTERVGADYTKLRRETEKLINYVGDKEIITADDVRAVSSVDVEAKIFDMLKCMGQKDVKGVLKKYYDLLSTGEPPLKIMALIRRQYITMLESAELGNKRMTAAEVAKQTGNQLFVIENAMLYMMRYYKMSDVRNIIYLINDTDMQIKNGNLNQQIAIEMLLVKIST